MGQCKPKRIYLQPGDLIQSTRHPSCIWIIKELAGDNPFRLNQTEIQGVMAREREISDFRRTGRTKVPTQFSHSGRSIMTNMALPSFQRLDPDGIWRPITKRPPQLADT